MSIDNALVEEMIFSPRLIPWTMKIPLRKVACGKRFTIVITTDGKAFSWGAGESGQLGTGRCTRRDLPSELPFSDRTILDVACGDGHAMAIDNNYSLFTWGLNHRGQCGVGDIAARYTPTLVSNGNNTSFFQVFAEGHSSAALDINRALYTWGSTTYGRLLQPDLTKEQPHEEAPDIPFIPPTKKEILRALTQPTKVLKPLNNGDDDIQFETFAFGKTRVVALVKTKLSHISPTKGPKRSFSALRIHGGGLWDATNIIVKFSSLVYSIYNPPRSVLGRLVDRSTIICKPPKFAELGMYTVSVSMDGGKVFLPDTFDVQVYKEVNVVHQSPPILDLRRPFIDLLTVKVHGSNVLSEHSERNNENNNEKDIAVKLSLHKVSGNNDNSNNISRQQEIEMLCRGAIISESTMASTGHNNENSLEETAGGSRPMTGLSTKSSDPHNESELIIECRHVSLADLALPSGLYEMTASVALNDQDYAGAVLHHHGGGKGAVAVVESEHVTLCHSFEVIEAIPSCYAISELQNVANILTEIREQQLHPLSSDGDGTTVAMTAEELNPHRFDRNVVVTANSVIPQQRLPKGAHIKAIATKAIITSVANPLQPPQECNTDTLDELLVHCDSSTALHFTMTSSFLQALNTWINDKNIDREVSMITLEWHFFLELAHEHEKLLMSEKALVYTFYPAAKVNVLPLAVRRAALAGAAAEGEAVAAGCEETVITLTADNLRFLPNSAVVRLHLPGAVEPVIMEKSKLMISETIDLVAAAPVATEGAGEVEAPVKNSPMYKVEFILPTYDSLFTRLPAPPVAADGSALPSSKLDYIHISLSLDGVKVPAEDKWAKVFFYSSLTKFAFQPALPKGGATAGSTIGLFLEEYCPIMPGGVLLRLRGADPATAAVISGSMTETSTATGALATTVSFTMPDAAGITANPPNVQGKEKLYFVDISIDGGLTFDQAAAPQLQIK